MMATSALPGTVALAEVGNDSNEGMHQQTVLQNQ